MKKHIKKTLSLILVLTCIMSLFASCDTEENDPWVMTGETKQQSDEYISPGTIYTKTYEYDSTGKLIDEVEIHENDGTIYTSSDFTYDENGNVISKSVNSSDNFNNHYTDYYKYSYDENGNCISETMDDTVSSGTTTYEYDSKNNLIKKVISSPDSSDEIYTYILTYENDLCVQSEISIEVHGLETEYELEKYTYDDNGNKISTEYYTKAYDLSNIKNPITVNGRDYRHNSTIFYTWEKLRDVAVEVETTSYENDENYNSSKTETATPTESPTIPMSSWGFENSYEWGNTLAQVQSTTSGNFIFTDGTGDYVVVKEGSHHWEFYPYQGQLLASSIYTDFLPKGTDVCTYTVLNNDTISVVEPWESHTLKITDRIEEDNALIFEVLNGNRNVYLIPYNLIDTSKTPVFYQEGDSYGDKSYDYYKFYLK